MENVVNPEALRAEQRQRLLEKMQRRLQNARKKLKALARAENELELQRARMAKTATVGGVTKSGTVLVVVPRVVGQLPQSIQLHPVLLWQALNITTLDHSM